MFTNGGLGDIQSLAGLGKALMLCNRQENVVAGRDHMIPVRKACAGGCFTGRLFGQALDHIVLGNNMELAFFVPGQYRAILFGDQVPQAFHRRIKINHGV
jgi:hypothetical protein